MNAVETGRDLSPQSLIKQRRNDFQYFLFRKFTGMLMDDLSLLINNDGKRHGIHVIAQLMGNADSGHVTN